MRVDERQGGRSGFRYNLAPDDDDPSLAAMGAARADAGARGGPGRGWGRVRLGRAPRSPASSGRAARGSEPPPASAPGPAPAPTSAPQAASGGSNGTSSMQDMQMP